MTKTDIKQWVETNHKLAGSIIILLGIGIMALYGYNVVTHYGIDPVINMLQAETLDMWGIFFGMIRSGVIVIVGVFVGVCIIVPGLALRKLHDEQPAHPIKASRHGRDRYRKL